MISEPTPDSIFLFLEEDSSVTDSRCSFSDERIYDPLEAGLLSYLVKVRLPVGTVASGGLSLRGDLRLRSFLYSFTTF